jgi:hypothetical protein
MVPEKRYPFLSQLLSPFWIRHRKTLGLIIAAIAVTGQARSFAIATTLARWLGTRLDSAVNRFYRLLRNARVDYTEFAAQWAKLLVRGKDRCLLVAVDWTEWHHDLRLLVAAVVSGKRAIPLFAQAFTKEVPRRSQNSRENTFARVLADAVRRAGATALLLCDRGFRRVSWIKLLQDLHLGFVVRLMADVQVEIMAGIKVPLRQVLLRQGQAMDLGVVPLRADGKAQVRVVGYWAPGAAEPWWVATSETGSASHVLQLYDRRMTVEEQFRDTKGKRFGVKLAWTQFRDPEALARFVMLLAVALLIWTLAGIAASRQDASLRLVHPTKGPRQSYVTIGLRVLTVEEVPSILISAHIIGRLLEAPTLRRIGKRCPGGK